MGNDGDGGEVVFWLDLQPVDLYQCFLVLTVTPQRPAILTMDEHSLAGIEHAYDPIARDGAAAAGQFHQILAADALAPGKMIVPVALAPGRLALAYHLAVVAQKRQQVAKHALYVQILASQCDIDIFKRRI